MPPSMRGAVTVYASSERPASTRVRGLEAEAPVGVGAGLGGGAAGEDLGAFDGPALLIAHDPAHEAQRGPLRRGAGAGGEVEAQARRPARGRGQRDEGLGPGGVAERELHAGPDRAGRVEQLGGVRAGGQVDGGGAVGVQGHPPPVHDEGGARRRRAGPVEGEHAHGGGRGGPAEQQREEQREEPRRGPHPQPPSAAQRCSWARSAVACWKTAGSEMPVSRASARAGSPDWAQAHARP